jgi:hypothetical protein
MPFWLTLVLGIIVPFKLYEVLAFKARAPHSIHLI